MTNQKFKTSNWVVGLSVLSIAMSIITITLFIFKVKESSVVDSVTYMSVMATFIGICATFIVGFQILNTLSIGSKMKEIDTIKNELEIQKIETKKMLFKAEGLTYFSKGVDEHEKKYYVIAFASYSGALRRLVVAGHHDLVKSILKNMNIIVEDLQSNSCGKYDSESIFIIKKNYEIIMTTENVAYIQSQLSKIYDKFIVETEKHTR